MTLLLFLGGIAAALALLGGALRLMIGPDPGGHPMNRYHVSERRKPGTAPDKASTDLQAAGLAICVLVVLAFLASWLPFGPVPR